MGRREEMEGVAIEVAKRLADQGKLIEAGFAIYEHCVLKGAPPLVVNELRIAFMAGAEHVWSSVLGMLDDDKEPTAQDMMRMALIQRELDEFRVKISERLDPAKGHA